MDNRVRAASGPWWTWSVFFTRTTTAARMSHIDGTLVMGVLRSQQLQTTFATISLCKLTTGIVSIRIFIIHIVDVLFDYLELLSPDFCVHRLLCFSSISFRFSYSDIWQTKLGLLSGQLFDAH